MLENNIDYKKLREDLLEFYRTTMGPLFPGPSMFMIEEIENAADVELIKIAKNNGFSIDDYRIKGKSL